MARWHNSLAGMMGAVAGAVALAAPGGAAQAASITWGTPLAIIGDTDVATQGSLLGAVTLGGGDGSATSTTVNGVAFTAFNLPNAFPATSGPFTLSASGNTNDAGAREPAGLSAAYTALLNTWGGAQPGGLVLTVTLGGLVAGRDYLFQTWRVSKGIDANSPVTATAGTSVILNSNPGQHVIGTFTADAVTQAISFAGVGNVPVLLNAMQLRDITPPLAVPEPASLALLGAALLGLGLARRRRPARG